jgi:cation transport ATPase
MNRIRTLAGRYPIVAVTVLVGLVVVGLLLSNHITAAQLLATAFALIIAVQTSIRMIKDLVRGHWGVDVLAVMAIVSTVAVGEYLAALVIVLMLSRGRGAGRLRSRPGQAGTHFAAGESASSCAPDAGRHRRNLRCTRDAGTAG